MTHYPYKIFVSQARNWHPVDANSLGMTAIIEFSPLNLMRFLSTMHQVKAIEKSVHQRYSFPGGAQQGGPGGPRPPLVLGPSPINPPGPPLVFLPQVSFGNLICTVRWQSLCSFQLILMLPVTNAISEWSFSAMRRKALSAWPEKSLRETWESQKRIRNPGQLSHETYRLLSSLSGQFDIGQSL